MSVKSYPKKVNEKLSPNFSTKEFKCPCSDCKVTLIDTDLIVKLEKMRAELGSKLTVTSGYRCPNYQHQLKILGYETAKNVSQHVLGKAADVTNGVALGAELEEAARKAGFQAVGVGRTWIHVDLRGPEPRRWFYTKSR